MVQIKTLNNCWDKKVLSLHSTKILLNLLLNKNEFNLPLTKDLFLLWLKILLKIGSINNTMKTNFSRQKIIINRSQKDNFLNEAQGNIYQAQKIKNNQQNKTKIKIKMNLITVDYKMINKKIKLQQKETSLKIES